MATAEQVTEQDLLKEKKLLCKESDLKVEGDQDLCLCPKILLGIDSQSQPLGNF